MPVFGTTVLQTVQHKGTYINDVLIFGVIFDLPSPCVISTLHYEKKLTKNIRPTDILEIYTKYSVNVLKFTKYLGNIHKFTKY